MISLRWRRRIRRYLNPKSPRAILSWRYLLPHSTPEIHLHRQVLFSCFSQRPLALWWTLTIHGFVLWYGFYGWIQSYRQWRRYSLILSEQENIPRFKQLRHILVLAFLHSVPPQFYYRYKLYRTSEKKWFNYIYTHELPQWHHCMSPVVSPESHAFLENKNTFSSICSRQKLPAIPTVFFIEENKPFDLQTLFVKQSFFLKPNTGSRKRGCFMLYYVPEEDDYQLKSPFFSDIHGRSNIVRELKSLAAGADYLIQPLLKNHPWFSNLFPYMELITIRLITVVNTAPETISAILEIPTRNLDNIPFRIETQGGELFPLKCSLVAIENQEEMNTLLQKKVLPHWEQIKHIAELAHRHCLDVKTVGWDLALTDQGVKILEGNFNWGVEAHQIDEMGLVQPAFCDEKIEFISNLKQTH